MGRQKKVSAFLSAFVMVVVCCIPNMQSVSGEDIYIVPDAENTDATVSSVDEESEVYDVSSIDDLIQITGEFKNSENTFGTGLNDEDSADASENKKLISSFKQTGSIMRIAFDMYDKPTLSSLLSQFPKKLDVYFVEESQSRSVSVTWESLGDDYSETDRNYYFFVPKINDSEYSIRKTTTPYIEVVKNPDVSYDMIESAPPEENEEAIFEYCTETLGLNTAAACGILANIYCESGFRTDAVGDSGTSVGLCQWHNGRWTSLREYCPLDWQVLKGQLRYMAKELRTGYSETYEYLLSVTDDEKGAYDAGYYWCLHYEMPDKVISRALTRGYLAKNVYWQRYGLEISTDGEEDDYGLGQGDMAGEDSESKAGIETEEEAAGDGAANDAGSGEEAAEEECFCIDSYAGDYICISENGLRIRSAHSEESSVVGVIPYEEIVEVTKANGEWAHVIYEDISGYCSIEFLDIVSDVDR